MGNKEMEKESRDIELMAPAGTFEALMAAAKAGADSVYFGVEQLNMRARSTMNFTLANLDKVKEVCGEYGMKAYMTLNTIIYDHDTSILKKVMQRAKEENIDGVIVSDLAAVQAAKEYDVPIHISTQVNISNIDAVKFFAPYADVMVMARELSLKQVGDIVREIERQQIKGPSGNLVRVEIFAHGALCMAVSGKCYLSLHSNNASANRGACIQNCRRSYTVKDEEGNELLIDNEFIMSSKDLCTIDFLDQVLDSGVKVLKIEGRGRAPEYVKTVIENYREAIDKYKAGEYNKEMALQLKENLTKVYNRGFYDGYYLGREMGEWSEVYGSQATTKKIFLGTGNKYFSKIGVAEFTIETHTLKQGDKILVTGPTTGVIEEVIKEIRVDDEIVTEAKRGDICSVKLSEKVRPSDKLYKVVDAV